MISHLFLYQINARTMLDTYIYHQLPPTRFGFGFTIFKKTNVKQTEYIFWASKAMASLKMVQHSTQHVGGNWWEIFVFNVLCAFRWNKKNCLTEWLTVWMTDCKNARSGKLQTVAWYHPTYICVLIVLTFFSIFFVHTVWWGQVAGTWKCDNEPSGVKKNTGNFLARWNHLDSQEGLCFKE